MNTYVQQAIGDKNRINITYSSQKESTNTMEFDLNNQSFTLRNEKVLNCLDEYDALLADLNDLEEDIIFSIMCIMLVTKAKQRIDQ